MNTQKEPIPAGFYTTKMLVEVEVSHQFDPEQGIDVVTSLLHVNRYLAVRDVKIISAESNFRLHQSPAETLTQ